jgi:hypothetical protein
MNNNDKNYIVFSMRLAGYLMLQGCRLIKTKPDKTNPNKHVYFFPKTTQVLEHVEKYKMIRN